MSTPRHVEAMAVQNALPGLPPGLANIMVEYAACTKVVATGNGGHAVVYPNGTVQTWGNEFCGGDSSSVRGQLVKVAAVYATMDAFAALLNSRIVVSWGSKHSGGECPPEIQRELHDITAVCASSGDGFLALRGDGKVFYWGSADIEMPAVVSGLKNVAEMYATGGDFAVRTDNNVVYAWGAHMKRHVEKVEDVAQVCSTGSAFAFRQFNGDVVCCGRIDNRKIADGLEDIIRLHATKGAFFALDCNGVLFSWGDWEFGAFHGYEVGLTAHNCQVAFGVAKVYCSDYACIIRYAGAEEKIQITGCGLDNSLNHWLVSWHDDQPDGAEPATTVVVDEDAETKESGVVNDEDENCELDYWKFVGGDDEISHFVSIPEEMVVVTRSGKVFTGGCAVDRWTRIEEEKALGSAVGVKGVVASSGALAALMADGRVVAWGRPSAGGEIDEPLGELLRLANVDAIFACPGGFVAAIQHANHVVAWGSQYIEQYRDAA